MYCVQEYEAALEFFQKMRDTAAAMETYSEDLVDQTTTWIDQTHKAWVASATDETAANAEKQKFEEQKAEEALQKKVLDEKIASEEKMIKDSLAEVVAAEGEVKEKLKQEKVLA